MQLTRRSWLNTMASIPLAATVAAPFGSLRDSEI